MASKRYARIVKIISGAVADAEEVFQLEGRVERFAHFWALATRQFIRNRCLVRASALSYSTLLALIPLLVVALSVTSNRLDPQQEARLTSFVEHLVSSVAPSATLPTNAVAVIINSNSVAGTATNLPDTILTNGFAAVQPVDTQKELARNIHDLVRKAGSGTLGVTGFVFLVFTSLSLLRGIEETLNDIWGVTRGRSWLTQFMLYWTIITMGPLLLSIALALTGSLELRGTQRLLEASPFLAPLLKHAAPIAILGFTLGMFYKLTPNTKVQFKAAMLGGFCAGAAWHFYNQLGFLLVARAMSASRLYGGVSLFVLLMGGLYILWLIILFGSQTAYAFQNRNAYLQDRLAENVNQRGREFVALRIMTTLARRFQNGLRPATVQDISSELGVPSRLTQSILQVLAATRLVTETAGPEAGFLPARPLDSINAGDVLMAMRTGSGQELPLSNLPELAAIYGEFARIEKAERDAAAGVTLLALARPTLPRAELPAPEPAASREEVKAPEKPSANT
jgi:membrane protein